MTHDPLVNALFYAMSFQLGILPIAPYESVRAALSQLGEQEARRTKRKFRKAWKRAKKQHIKRLNLPSRKRAKEETEFGYRGRAPGGRQSWIRKITVYSAIATEAEKAVKNAVHKQARAPPGG